MRSWHSTVTSGGSWFGADEKLTNYLGNSLKERLVGQWTLILQRSPTECFLKEGIVTPLHKHGMKENSQGLCRLSPGRGLCGIHEFPSTHWKTLLSLKPQPPQNGPEGAVSNSKWKLSSATASVPSVRVLAPLWPSWSLQWHAYARLTVLLARILRWPGRGGVLP